MILKIEQEDEKNNFIVVETTETEVTFNVKNSVKMTKRELYKFIGMLLHIQSDMKATPPRIQDKPRNTNKDSKSVSIKQVLKDNNIL